MTRTSERTRRQNRQPKRAEPTLRLEWRSPQELAENPSNWRTHPQPQLAALTDVIAEVGWAGACLYNERTQRLIDGHARRKVALDQGTPLVPVLVGNWTEDQERKILATLDPLTAMAEADSQALASLLASVQSSSDAVNAMLKELSEANPLPLPDAGAGGDDFDSTPEETGPTRTSVGEVWVIGGKHRLFVGDCTDSANVAILMAGEKAKLCNTDPPYGIAYDSASLHNNKTTYDAIDNDGIDGAKLQSFLESYIRAAVPFLVDNAAWYMWHPMLTQGTFFAAAAAADILISRQIIWVKPQLIFGRGEYHWKHELCFYGWRRGNRPDFYGERNQTTVWEINYAEGRNDREHPTQKPIELFDRPILNHTKANEIAYEPFAGSGSQFIAAHRLNRRCFGCEIEPRYADVILRRAEAEGLTCEKDA